MLGGVVGGVYTLKNHKNGLFPQALLDQLTLDQDFEWTPQLLLKGNISNRTRGPSKSTNTKLKCQ